jgi:hypothetical protein
LREKFPIKEDIRRFDNLTKLLHNVNFIDILFKISKSYCFLLTNMDLMASEILVAMRLLAKAARGAHAARMAEMGPRPLPVATLAAAHGQHQAQPQKPSPGCSQHEDM